MNPESIIVATKEVANAGAPFSSEELQRMARRRFQDPKPKKHGDWWTIRVREDEFVEGKLVRRNKRVRLGAVGKFRFREAEKLAAEHLRGMNQGLQPVGSAVTFADYVKHTYIPIVLPTYASSGADRYEGVCDNYLVPEFGHMPLRAMTALTLQKYFSQAEKNEKLKNLSRESINKVRNVLASVLESARKYQLLMQNPMKDVELLPDKKGKRIRKPFITPQQFIMLLSFISEPYASMIFVAIYTGLRVSELIGLKWEDVHENSITIDERYCRGDWAQPKSDASNATIPVNKCVIDRIHRLRDMTVEVRAGLAVRKYKVVKSSAPCDLVFQSVRTGTTMRDNNILSRHLKPAGKKVGLDFVNWLVLRRSHSNWLRMAGADLKDRQAQMRHAHPQTTADIYDQFIPENQMRVVEKLSKLTETIQ